LIEVHSVESSLRAPETLACPVAFSFNRIKENAMRVPYLPAEQ